MIAGLLNVFGQFSGVVEFTILVLAAKETWDICKKVVSIYNKK